MQGGVASILMFAGADAVKSSQEKKGAKGKRNKTNVVILYSPTCAHCIGLLPDRNPSSPRWWSFVDGGRVSPAAAAPTADQRRKRSTTSPGTEFASPCNGRHSSVWIVEFFLWVVYGRVAICAAKLNSGACGPR